MQKTVVYLMIITIISKVFGFFRDLTLSFFYGASSISDAYIISTTIPMVIFSFIGEGISTGYIPIFTDIIAKAGKKEADKYTSNLINIVLLIDTILVIICLIFTPQIIKIFAMGFEGEVFNISVNFTRITIVGIYFTSIIYIFRPYLQLNNNYIIPALIGIPLNIVVIISIYIAFNYNENILAIGSVISIICQMIIMIPFIYKLGYIYNLKIDFKDKYLLKTVAIAIPAVIGVSVNQINVIVDKTIASNLATGSVSALNYGYKLNGLVQGIFIVSTISVLFPKLSKMASEKNIDGLKESIINTINIVNILVLPAVVGIIALANPIVEILFGRGAFDTNAIIMTSKAVIFYSIGIVGFGMRDILTRAFYALKDSKTPVNNSIIALCINIILNIILSRYIGISGLALATSIASNICAVLMLISLRRKIGSLEIKNMIIVGTKAFIASAIMGIVVKSFYNIFESNIRNDLLLVVSIIIGIIIYCIILLVSNISEVNIIFKKMKARLSNTKEL